jgi:hypothetical protein
VELKPPKNKPRTDFEELENLSTEARARVGQRHWVSAASSLILHFRSRMKVGGSLDATSVAYGCRFLGWLIDCDLPMPPSTIVRTPVSIVMDCASYLAPIKPITALGGSDASTASVFTVGPTVCATADRRCIAGRLLTQFLLPLFDASGEGIADVANTRVRVAALRTWLVTMRGTCGRLGCGKKLGNSKAADGGAACEDVCTDAKDVVPPLACGRCKQVRYCGRECQTADWKERHKAGCLSATEPLAGDAAWELLVSSGCVGISVAVPGSVDPAAGAPKAGA